MHWLKEPEDHDYEAAAEFLSLLMHLAYARNLARSLRKARRRYAYKAKDILRASHEALLPVDNAHVAADLAKIKAEEKLSPVLLVVLEGRMIIADGYHRVCASYWTDENAEIPCHVVWP